MKEEEDVERVGRVQLGVFQTASLPVSLGNRLNSPCVTGAKTVSVYLWENTTENNTIRLQLFLR